MSQKQCTLLGVSEYWYYYSHLHMHSVLVLRKLYIQEDIRFYPALTGSDFFFQKPNLLFCRATLHLSKSFSILLLYFRQCIRFENRLDSVWREHTYFLAIKCNVVITKCGTSRLHKALIVALYPVFKKFLGVHD